MLLLLSAAMLRLPSFVIADVSVQPSSSTVVLEEARSTKIRFASCWSFSDTKHDENSHYEGFLHVEFELI